MAKYTREKILCAFFELVTENPQKTNFTISEIALKAGVSRQAIYQKHFRNFNEIITYVDDYIIVQVRQWCSQYNIEKDGNPMDYIANKLLPFVYENREYLKTLHTATVAKSFEDTIIVSFTEWAIDIIRPQSETFNLPKDVLTKIIVEQIVVIIKTWLLQEAPMPPQEFKKDFLNLAKAPLYSYYTMETQKS
ncbi:TetR/AcrR family transcriptional regulator [Streptococcus equinus]|uniref:TetR/AcrR family transcriptional regulator n=1 Tax=Streptococcus equinus TaxID=1335 RepID=UPI0008ECA568|nr:TetR/AcrR family transcriptional regulator [Streptococcus equinus]UOC11112.1 TetR/AcrR family transcriptional regulator [Streptococcus equinus]SFQ55669.1 transcriptional regulator, TetR family [Streptococcus equinus]